MLTRSLTGQSHRVRLSGQRLCRVSGGLGAFGQGWKSWGRHSPPVDKTPKGGFPHAPPMPAGKTNRQWIKGSEDSLSPISSPPCAPHVSHNIKAPLVTSYLPGTSPDKSLWGHQSASSLSPILFGFCGRSLTQVVWWWCLMTDKITSPLLMGSVSSLTFLRGLGWDWKF